MQHVPALNSNSNQQGKLHDICYWVTQEADTKVSANRGLDTVVSGTSRSSESYKLTWKGSVSICTTPLSGQRPSGRGMKTKRDGSSG